MKWTGPNGIQTSSTVVSADTTGKTYRDVIIQNQSSTATLYIKLGSGASSSVWDFTLPAGSLPTYLGAYLASETITAYSTDLKYSVAYRFKNSRN